MGNESSKLNDLKIESAAVETTRFWSLHNAVAATTAVDNGIQCLSVFQNQRPSNEKSPHVWNSHQVTDRTIKNFKIYRHPYILKYVTNWKKSGGKYLATERVRPLHTILHQQSQLDVCLGLRAILCSLVFLIEKAMARHLNICISSIYVTESGGWRLAGFENVWKASDITKELLIESHAYRYKNAIDPNELNDDISCGSRTAIEQYAFAILCEEVLDNCFHTSMNSNVAIPQVAEFRRYCSTDLKNSDASVRSKLSSVLLHPYFNHEFVVIHAFLFELPLKQQHEKQKFFTGLIDRLRSFDEQVVCAQFAKDLLSRMVLLDSTAQLCVTPYVLRAKTECNSLALFSPKTFKRYLIPIILQTFRLRDAHIRLILLEYFDEFICFLTAEQIVEHILTHLLDGMKDINEVLIAKTLRCLADLIPILGANKVLGGQRYRLFADGRPQALPTKATTVDNTTATPWIEPRSITPVVGENTDYPMVSASPTLSQNVSLTSLSQAIGQKKFTYDMPQRHSPDGGEDHYLATTDTRNPYNLGTNINSAQYTDDAWFDWDTEEEQLKVQNHIQTTTLGSSIARCEAVENCVTVNSLIANSTKLSKIHSPEINDDLNSLDIQVQASSCLESDEVENATFDFFKDMEPIIETKTHNVQCVQQNAPTSVDTADIIIDANRFAAARNNDEEDIHGWCEDDCNLTVDETDEIIRPTRIQKPPLTSQFVHPIITTLSTS